MLRLHARVGFRGKCFANMRQGWNPSPSDGETHTGVRRVSLHPGGLRQAVGSPAPGGRRKARLAAQRQPSKAPPPPQPPRGPSAPAPWVRVPSDGSWLPGPALPPWGGGACVVPGPRELLAQAVPWQKVKRRQGADRFFKGRKMSNGARRDLLRFSDSVPTASLPCVGG